MPNAEVHAERDGMRERRCEDCGGRLFFNHNMSSTKGGEWTHTHPDCKRAASTIERLPVIYDLAIQSLVEIDELLGRFICESDDEDYGDVKALQAILHRASVLSGEGVRSEARDREAIEELSRD